MFSIEAVDFSPVKTVIVEQTTSLLGVGIAITFLVVLVSIFSLVIAFLYGYLSAGGGLKSTRTPPSNSGPLSGPPPGY